MHPYEWDEKTGGILLRQGELKLSKEPRPVYSRELDLYGFGKLGWEWERQDDAPYMWAEAGRYYYRGRLAAKITGGGPYSAPEIIPMAAPCKLCPVDIAAMREKNRAIMESLADETMERLYKAYLEYRDEVDAFYVAYSGGKDSEALLDIAMRALPKKSFFVVFGDTGMEFRGTYAAADEAERKCRERGVEFMRARTRLIADESWRLFGPPSARIRWCCSVHKSAPQALALKKRLGKAGAKLMALVGVRAAESLSRRGYEYLSFGKKQAGQYNCNVILDWGSAEVWSYIYMEGLHLNEAYKKGSSRVGCVACPNATGRQEFVKRQLYKREYDALMETIRRAYRGRFPSCEKLDEFIEAGGWKARATGRDLPLGVNEPFFGEDGEGRPVITVRGLGGSWREWAKTMGSVAEVSEGELEIAFRGKPFAVRFRERGGKTEFTFPNWERTRAGISFLSLFKSCVIKGAFCAECGECESVCPAGCIGMGSGVSIGEGCLRCGSCHGVERHCLRYNSLRRPKSARG